MTLVRKPRPHVFQLLGDRATYCHHYAAILLVVEVVHKYNVLHGSETVEWYRIVPHATRKQESTMLNTACWYMGAKVVARLWRRLVELYRRDVTI
jgi:hypothetical protein